LTIFDEKSEKSPKTGRGRISVTVSDRHVGPTVKCLFLMIFDEKSPKSPKIGSGRISATTSDRSAPPKLKWPSFDDF
jgi:hypothetical protein